VFEEEFTFTTFLGDAVVLRWVPQGTRALTHEDRMRAREVLREVRLGVRSNQAPVLNLVQRLDRALGQATLSTASTLDATLESEAPLRSIVERLEEAFEAGRLIVTRGAFPLLAVAPDLPLTLTSFVPDSELPPEPPRAAVDEKLTFFEVRFVDEVGQAIGGFDVQFSAGSRVEKLPTNPAGVATLEDVRGASASVSVVSVEALGKIVEPRWEKVRPGSAPTGVNTQTFAFTGGAIGGISLKPAVPNTVVITPPRGKLFVELWDKFGRTLHKQQRYELTGPASFSGETDDEGRFLHEGVAFGDYKLKLSLEIDPGDGSSVTDTYESKLVVLEANAGEPQQRMLGVLPRVVMARMRGMLFDTNKCFLLPTAIEALRRIRQIYALNSPCNLLIVGHTDTTAEPDINNPLSVERAKSMQAYLEDDVQAWLDNYELSGKKCWGSREDRLMITAMPDFATRGEDEDLVEWFQRTRKLEVDGVAGPKTRKQLITEYMGLDGAKLSEEPGFEIDIQTHGVGENHPLAETGFELDTAAADGKEDPFDRRVELFFFDKEFGVVPAPAAPDGDEYLKWREHAAENDDFPIEGVGKQAIVVEVHDALFRTNSCVVLPEGEAPSTDEHGAITSVGLIATALRFNEEHRNLKLVVAGHTDTTATVEFNQTLSEERAKCALALLVGDRAEFVKLVDQRHTVADYKQILSWCSEAFEDVEFDCDPGKIDDNAATGVEPLKKFQTAYNANKAAIGASAPDLSVDGDIGPLTWGAIFDVFEFGVREELGEDAAALAALRKKLVFVDDERKALGFSEHHPVDQIGRDGVRSQTNRRVEILFFETGEEPDLVLAESDPDISDVYLPAEYRHRPVDAMVSAKRWTGEWDQPDVPTKLDEKRAMLLDAPGLPAGLPITFEVEQLIEGELAGLLTTIASTSAEASATDSVTDWFNPELAVFAGELAEDAEFPDVTFRFVASGGGRRIESAELAYEDFIALTLVHEVTKVPVAEAPFVLQTPWGFRPGATDKDGKLRVEGLAPGGALVVPEDHLMLLRPEEPLAIGEPNVEETKRVRIRLVDLDFSPLVDIPVSISRGNIVLERRTDEDGFFEEFIPVTEGKIFIQYEGGEGELTLATLKPVKELDGARVRLKNLGYTTGTGAELDPLTLEAILQFRSDKGLGEPEDAAKPLDKRAQDALVEAHGS